MPGGDSTGPIGQGRAGIGRGRGGSMGYGAGLQVLMVNTDVLIMDTMKHIRGVPCKTKKCPN